MKKIPTIFLRNPLDMSRVISEPHPDCYWVFAGEGWPTQKLDGTCCMVRAGRLYKRRELKGWNLLEETLPRGFEVEEHDYTTGKTFGWMPVGNGKEDRWHREAWTRWLAIEGELPPGGTYELIGPKVQGNPERVDEHKLVRHGQWILGHNPRAFDELQEWFKGKDLEGIVWHHPDGRMAKIKLRDFGLKRGGQ